MTARARTGNQTETGAGRAARRGRLDTPAPRAPGQCPVEQWLAFLGHRWNALLLWHLSAGPRRYGELRRLLPGVSSKVLAERLAWLERHGLASRSVLRSFPKAVSYSLTTRGNSLVCALGSIEAWARDAAPDPGARP